MVASIPAWLNTLTILGGLLTIGAAVFLVYRIGGARKTYRDLRPQRNPGQQEPSGTVMFMFVGFIVLALGLLLLGLGIAGSASPEELGTQSELMRSVYTAFSGTA